VKASIDQALAHVNSLQATVESDQAAVDASRAQAEKAAKDLHLDLFQWRSFGRVKGSSLT
jgi:multidrug resistance efflux pump